MNTQSKRPLRNQDGFTLIEVLAALAIASVIIIASTAMIHNVALFFDRGTRGASEAERVMLAVERLGRDFGSARFVARRAEGGSVAAAFAAEQASSERPASISFVGPTPAGSWAGGDELINLAVEEDGDLRRLVRRRAAWGGSRTRFEDAKLQDPVVLIEGRLDISFLFARVTPDGGLAWYASWSGETVLPRYVRLLLKNRATGVDLLGEADFAIRANASAACGRSEAALGCLSAPLMMPSDATDDGRPSQ